MRNHGSRFWISYLFVATICAILVMELAVRLMGYEPWNPDTRVDIRVEPGQRLFQRDSLLGYRHLPGSFHITLPTGLEFDITHNENTYRITRPPDSYLEDRPRPELWIFGGSFVHGWSLDDHETFPWILQERFDGYDVVNFGVGGYGTVQSYLKIGELLGNGRQPSIIVVAYSALHDERNTLLRSRVKEVAAWNHLGPMNQPVAAQAGADSLIIRQRKISYRPVPLIRQSALVHCIDLAINKVQRYLVDSHGVTRKLLLNIYEMASRKNIPVVLAHIYAGPESESLLDWARESGLHVVDISVDLQQHGMSNRPFDAHPSAKANQYYATVLGNFLVNNQLVPE